ncbi:MAG: acyl-CoA synthetase, partial [Solirubrobacterales bacterium]
MPSLPTQIHNRLHTARALFEAGIIAPLRPDKLVRVGLAVARFGPTPAAGYTAAAIRHPDEVGIIDELGQLTFAEIHERTNRLAHALSDRGINEGDNVGIMIRNHRGFIDATVACSKLGANALYLNTAFAAPQLTDVANREKPTAVIYDAEFTELMKDAGHRRKRFIAW